MTLLKDNNYKEINVALLSLEADIKNKIANFDTSVIDKQLAEINSRIDKINAGGSNSSAAINDIRYEIEDINSKLNGNSAKIKNIEQKLSDIFSAENKVTDFNTTTNSGIYYWLDDASNKPGTNYGVLLVNKYDDGQNSSIWINQIAYGTNNKIYFRQNINSGNWTEWKAVAFDGEITAYKVANALTVNGKTYDGSEAVDAGVQTVANGGTGATNAADGFNTLADGVRDSSTPRDDEKMLLKPHSGTWYKTTCLDFWNYIKDKISSVLGLTKDNYGGKAATAGKANFLDEYVGAGGTRLTSGNIVPKDSSEYGGMRKDVVTDSMTDSGRPGADGHLLTMFWDNSGRYDSQFFVSNNSPLTVKVRTKANATDYGPWVDVITSNNIGSQTVASAGTADSARNMYYQNLDLSALDKTKFYPLFCWSGNNFAEVAIHSEGGVAAEEYNQNRIHFDISTMGWSDTPPTLNIREYACYQNNEITIGCIGRGVHYGAWALWLRGGIRYYCYTRNCDLSLKTSDYTYGDETYTVGTNYYGGSNTNVEVWFTPQSTITEGAYSSRPITAPNIKAKGNITLDGDGGAGLVTYGSEPLTIGFPSGTNDGKSLGFDRNSIQARTNGSASVMYLNYNGGMVSVNEQNQINGGLKVKQKMVIPIGAPSSLQDGCIWIS